MGSLLFPKFRACQRSSTGGGAGLNVAVQMGLENHPCAAHIGAMREEHHFTVIVEPDLLRSGRYRWAFCQSGQVRDRSAVSFATRREAQADATKSLQKRIAAWQACQ